MRCASKTCATSHINCGPFRLSSLSTDYPVGVSSVCFHCYGECMKKHRTHTQRPRVNWPNTGFTLLELLVAISIVAILVAAAAPSMRSTLMNSAVKGHHRSMESALNFARGEAVSRADRVVICNSQDGDNCSGNTDWTDGWLIFVDEDNNGIFGAGDNVLRVEEYNGDAVLTVFDSGLNAIRGIGWDGRGYLSLVVVDDGALDRTNLSALAVVCDQDETPIYTRGLMVAQSGRIIRAVDTTGDGIKDYQFDGGAVTSLACNLGGDA